jgi:lambda family phage portal protein
MALRDIFRGKPTPPPPPTVAKTIRRGARAEYDAATLGRRAAGWRRTRLDANGELSPAAMAALRGIARDLVRNNPFAARGVSAIANNLVGTGITFQVYRNGEIDEKLNAIARKHFDTNKCDAAGRMDLYGLQLQAARTIVESGAVIARRRWRKASDRLPVPFQIQVLEPDYIDPSKHGPLDTAPGLQGGFAVNGIQFSPIGRREGYWLYGGHPGAARVTAQGSSFIPAADIAHVFRADRPEQEHGATWFAPVVLRMKDFGDYEDGQLTRQKLASAYVGFISNKDDIGTDPSAGDGGDREPYDYIETGTFLYGQPGEEVTFSNPPSVEGYKDYAQVSLRAISAGLGVPYEALTGDLSNVNFSSGRMGWLEFQRSLAAWQWDMFIPQFCGSVEQWFIDALETMGEKVDGVSFEWTPPGREMINPSEEIKANRDGIRSGQLTPFEVVKMRGRDPDRHFAEFKTALELFDKLGLVLDCDPRRVTAVGNPAEPQSTTPEGA